MKCVWTSLRVLCVFTVITGLMYPAFMWLIGQTVFPKEVNGSLVYHNGAIVGSRLIGQEVQREDLFHSRFSVTSFQTLAASASNLSPVSATFKTSLKEGVADFVTSSGSGLDPHISVEAAKMQTDRIAEATQIPLIILDNMIRDTTEAPTFGIFGKQRVNVLMLNLRLLEYNNNHGTHSS